MKCENCGGSLSLEDYSCPHCGTLNKHAQQHIKDMNRYQGEFKNTQSDVYDVSKNYAGITVRAVIITILVVLILILLVLAAMSYDIRRNILRGRADRNYEEYSTIMDQYLAEEDYMAFNAFVQGKGIEYFDTEYERYYPVIRATNQYTSLYKSILAVYANSRREDGEEFAEDYIEALSNDLEYFYKSIDSTNYSYYDGADSEENQMVLSRIQEQIKVLLSAYCGLTEEDLAEWDDLSAAKRTVILEERIANGK